MLGNWIFLIFYLHEAKMFSFSAEEAYKSILTVCFMDVGVVTHFYIALWQFYALI